MSAAVGLETGEQEGLVAPLSTTVPELGFHCLVDDEILAAGDDHRVVEVLRALVPLGVARPVRDADRHHTRRVEDCVEGEEELGEERLEEVAHQGIHPKSAIAIAWIARWYWLHVNPSSLSALPRS